MVSVAVMKDPDGGAMQKAAAPTYIRMFPASRCARSATGVSLPRSLAGGEQHLTSGIDHDDSRTSCHRFG